MNIDSIEQLRALYPAPTERAVRKQLSALDVHCRRFIELSPFVVLASGSKDGAMDASPRGGAPGFVKAPDGRTLLIPMRRATTAWIHWRTSLPPEGSGCSS